MAFASEDRLEQICIFMEELAEKEPKRFRNIIIYAGIRKNKEKIKLKHEEKMKLLLKSISNFETGSIFLIDFEFSSDIFVQLIQNVYCEIRVVFINCKIIPLKSIESYQKVIFKSSKIDFIN